jgi:uncharacterized membrane-anchored protein
MKKFLAVLGIMGLAIGISDAATGERKIDFLKGPAVAKMEKVAQIDVPVGYVFLDGKTTRALLKASGEPVSGNEMGLLEATNEHWSVVFEFRDIGYVKDDDKDKLDADKLLAAIKRGTAEQNKVREQAGNPPLEVVGWEVPPRYDETTHNLEWAVRATSAGHQILNYNTRLLGRKGVMELILIVEPDSLPQTLPTYRKVMAGYAFQPGNSYAEYKSGDKVAKYGLAALVVGGAAVGAAKLGLLTWVAVLFKKAWKLIVLAFAAIASFFKKLFSRRDSQRAE